MGESLNGKIFLNEQRGCIAASGFRRNCTFNFDTFHSAYKVPFGNLTVFNEEVLAPGVRIEMVAGQDCYVVLLPVTGRLIFQNSQGQDEEIQVGQVAIHGVKTGDAFGVINPDEQEAIQFLQLWIRTDKVEPLHLTHDFEFSGTPDTLVPVTPAHIAPGTLPFKIHLGTFGGRGETVYQMSHPEGHFFCFVLAGAFEVQGRLMHALDGLGLWDLPEVEMEALSNHAVILVFEHAATYVANG